MRKLLFVLLGLGVVAGYGSAFHEMHHGNSWCHRSQVSVER
jgi:hypothetical protein